MSWIRKHWDQDFISQAEDKIRETVRNVYDFYAWNVLPILHKMQEYREKMGAEQSTRTADPLVTADMPKYMSLAEQYGIAEDMEIGESSELMQTIEQELQAYITAMLSPKNVNILKFWEVGSNGI